MVFTDPCNYQILRVHDMLYSIIQTYVRTFEEKVSLEPEKNTREFLEVKIFKRNQ